MTKKKKKPVLIHKHYSGPKSKKFWKMVNSLPSPDHDALYLAGVLLQDMEHKVLGQLEAALTAKRVKKSQEMRQDACEVCHGLRGGTPGNENIINGKAMCDYCYSDYLEVTGLVSGKRSKTE